MRFLNQFGLESSYATKLLCVSLLLPLKGFNKNQQALY